MSKFRELDLLREQEHTLIQLHMTLSDQLNRLKVEELALTSKLRLQKEREMQAQTGTSDQTSMGEEAIEKETMQVLDLVVNNSTSRAKEEAKEEEEDEEEEDEEEEEIDDGTNTYNDQLSSYLEQLLQQQQQQQHEETLDLQLAMNQVKSENEEEEEFDDDENDSTTEMHLRS